ncbi:hypothetical protein QVD17_04319 [Tagetes erecta]|uniref:Uncharacterized protein n=1 Tax=Tagetes erecta TaxID=13708 RepID=A0AAD8P480_TARER|nr:hypothetical protein QVD17_04319 [Tagetes erecta]
MGNYMETCIQRKLPAEEESTLEGTQQQEQEKQDVTISGSLSKESNKMRVKLVLTKDELQWLLMQMKKEQGGRKLEQVLEEIEKSRVTGENVTKWKPCLESIMESPETHHHMDR